MGYLKKRQRAHYLSVTISYAVLLGLLPTGAQATELVVEGNVPSESADCLVSISQTGSIDLGAPNLATVESLRQFFGLDFEDPGIELPNIYMFAKENALSISWETSAREVCSGALHAEHAGFKKNGVELALDANIGIGLVLDALDGQGNPTNSIVGVTVGVSSQVATSPNSNFGNESIMDVAMFVSPDLGPGTYGTVLTFTVVPD